MRQARAGRLQMALHAYFETPLGREPAGIDNCRASGVTVAASGHLNMLAPGSMAALAIDTLRDAAGEQRFVVAAATARFNFRVSGVTEHALIRELAAKIE